jgi:hypothetical protein
VEGIRTGVRPSYPWSPCRPVARCQGGRGRNDDDHPRDLHVRVRGMSRPAEDDPRSGETVAVFEHDGSTYEIDNLGTGSGGQWGEFAVYCDGEEVDQLRVPLMGLLVLRVIEPCGFIRPIWARYSVRRRSSRTGTICTEPRAPTGDGGR